MAGYIFEETTAAQAASFRAADDTLLFRASPESVTATYAPASSLQVAQITLTAGTTSLSFAATEIANNATGITFLSGGSAVFDFDGGAVALTDTTRLGYGITLSSGTQPTYNFTIAAGTGLHTVVGSTGNDTIAGGDADGAVNAFGGAGADTITLGDGNNHVYGNSSSSMQNAADGNDSITVGTGSNYINGNAGNDTITVGAAGSTGVNRVFGGSGTDTITITGAGFNSVNGNLGGDTITAVAATGNNMLRGGQGDDSITAGLGQDVVMGDLGADTLVSGTGGAHLTVMTGGDGADVFRFTGAQGTTAGTGTVVYYNEVTDFTHGVDKIDLPFSLDSADLVIGTGASFTSVTAAQAFALQILQNHAAVGANEVAAVQVGGDTYLFYNSTGGDVDSTVTSLDSTIKLTGMTAGNLTQGTTPSTQDFI